MSSSNLETVDIPRPELNNPGLIKLADDMDQVSEMFVEQGTFYLEATAAIAVRDEIDKKAPETNMPMRVQEALGYTAYAAAHTLGELARKFTPLDDRSDQIDFSLILEVGRQIPSSELTSQLAGIIGKTLQGKPLIEQEKFLTTVARVFVNRAAEVDSTEPVTLKSHADSLARPLRNAADLGQKIVVASIQKNGADPSSRLQINNDFMKEMIDVVSELPTDGSLAGFTGIALFDTLRGLAGKPSEFIMKQEGHDPDELLAAGVDESIILLFCASKILDLSNLAVGEAQMSDVKRLTAVGLLAGVKKGLKLSRATNRGSFDDVGGLSPESRLIANAHEALATVYKAAYSRKDLINQLRKAKLLRAFAGSIRNNLADDLVAVNDTFYGDITKSLDETELTSDLLAEVLSLESYKIEKSLATTKRLQSLGAISIQALPRLESLSTPRILKYLEHLEEMKGMESLGQAIDDIKGQIGEIEEPFSYTSKRIRSFEKGLILTREIEQLLDGNEFGGDEFIARALSILVLQSESAEDPNQYFLDLKLAGLLIEDRFADLKFLGGINNFRSPLRDTLGWIDEVLDSGKEESIKHYRLRRMVENYLLGVGIEESLTADDMQNPELENEAPYETTEADADGNEEIPTPPVSEQETGTEPLTDKEPDSDLVTYIQTLDTILQGTPINHVDINVFPPGRTDRKTGLSVETDRNNSAYIDLDPNRLKNLVDMAKTLSLQGKVATLSWTNPTSWAPLPHFVLYIQNKSDPKTGICILESPVNNNASYVFKVDGTLITDWTEVAALSKKEARDFGADTFIHPAKDSFAFNQHYKLKLMQHVMLTLGK